MKSKNRVCLFAAILVLVFLLSSPKGAVDFSFSYYSDHESSMDNKISAWTSSVWQQTTKEDFEADVLYQVDVATASGDVILATTTSGYVTQGTITSTVFDGGRNAAHFDGVFWASDVPSETGITFAARASDEFFEKGSSFPAWTNIGSNSGVSTGLPTGRYLQWTATLTTNDTATSPVLSEVSVYYH